MFTYKLLIFEIFSDGKDPNVVPVIYLVDIDPLYKFL